MLTRSWNSMSDDIVAALTDAGVRDAYDHRPAYQRNDYLSWIERARTADTRLRRIGRMVSELARGGVYMGMEHTPSRKATR